MTPAEALDKLLPRWKASLPAELSPEVVDRFVAQWRPALLEVMGTLLTVRRIRRGALPRTVEEFSAARLLAERERKYRTATDADITRRVARRTERLLDAAKDAAARDEVSRMGEHYVLLRAEAQLLAKRGWDAVPLLLRRPLLVVFSAKSAVLVHRHAPEPEESVFPGLERSVTGLRADLELAHRTATMIAKVGDPNAPYVCRRCGSRLREPARHYAIGNLECPAGDRECIDAEVDAEEMRRQSEETRRRLAENPVPVFTPPDGRAERAKREADRRWRREQREREKQEAARRRADKASAKAQEELDALDVLIAPEPVDRFGRMVHETRWASRAAAVRQLERAGFKFIKGSQWREGHWSRFPRTAVVKGATVQVTATP